MEAAIASEELRCVRASNRAFLEVPAPPPSPQPEVNYSSATMLKTTASPIAAHLMPTNSS